MKLITYSANEAVACGLLADKGIIDVKSIWQEGDVIECRIEKLGVSTNSLGPEPSKYYEPLTG